MEPGIAIFAYNRSWHLFQVLEGLKKNKGVNKLYIFQDGLKNESHYVEWKKVNTLIKEVDWCTCEKIISKENIGLANSITKGVDYILEKHDSVIVLEDDCVPHPAFMTFMTDSLQKYKEHMKVYSVSGYAYPLEIASNGTDAYFTRRVSSWGWGTWRDRWAQYKKDYKIIGRIKNKKSLAEQLHIWGEDLESYLLGNMYGRCDSWATFWALTVIEKEGYCLSPYKSLIKNIGFDGTGRHCGNYEIPQYLYEEDKDKFFLPEKVEIPVECEMIFSDYFSWISEEKRLSIYNKLLIKWITCFVEGKVGVAKKLIDKGIKRCSIWGKGILCDLLLKELNGSIEVLSIIETDPKGKKFNGISIVDVNNIPERTQLIIVIPIYDFEKIKRMAEKITLCKMLPLDILLET